MSKRPIVTVNEGKLLGVSETSRFSGTEYLAFYGVPYGEPPIENLRFRDPLKVKPWKGLRKSTTPKDGCIQFSARKLDYIGTEDCLYTNIYTPTLPSNDEPLKPVVVCLHPGGYLWGSPDPSQHGSPDFIIHNDIIYVTVCFRLHILGFLNLNIKDCTGNQAIKDIIMAFQWIKANIKNFNGDPSNITALGCSSSSALLNILMMIPAGEGLFHKAVLMGLHVSNCLISLDLQNTSIAFEFGQALGFDDEGSKKLLSFLKNVPAIKLIKQMKKTFEKYHEKVARVFPTSVFVPTNDGKIITEAFLKDVQATRRIPMMFGICEKEAVVGFIGKNIETTEVHYKTSIRQNILGWPRNIDDKNLNRIFEQADEFYFGKDSKNRNCLTTKINILTDAGLSNLYPNLIDVVSADLPASVFIYKFEYNGELGALKTMPSLRSRIERLEHENVKGTYHSDDFGYWGCMNDPESEATKDLIKKFTKLICTFARTGNPNYEGIEEKWRPSNQQEPCYLSINDSLQMVDGKLNNDGVVFWENLSKTFSSEEIK